MPEHDLPLGAQHANGTTTFCVWAPERQSVEVVIEGWLKPAATTEAGTTDADVVAAFRRPLPMERRAGGYWCASVDHAPPGTLYRYRLDHDDSQVFPDPASRFQPDGVHGPSEVIDAAEYAWRHSPTSRRIEDIVFYELHVGAFTPRGTFCAAIERLQHLRELGVTAIEIMPVADFPGRWNWGYDGVALFAPSRAYGRPEHLRALIDAAHGHGLSVFLDVVYNHLGPDGAYARAFSPFYFTDRHRSPWGQGVNLDGPHSEHVRRFFIENALHWVREYKVDGLRLDATHALVDDSPRHFVEELTTTVRDACGGRILFVAEDERDIRDRLAPPAEGGWGLDGVWADAFHHEVRVHVAGDREGYFAKYSGTTAAIAKRINGAEPGCVTCIQNHDQVGNRADGARLNHEIEAAAFRAVSALLLLAPGTPLIFMGQEWAASTPFLYFTDHHTELGVQVTEGRRREFQAFAAFVDPAARERIPDPQDPRTFAASRLCWDELGRGAHTGVNRLYRRLLQLRPQLVDNVTARALDEQTIVLSSSTTHTIVRLDGEGTVTLDDSPELQVLLTTEDPEFVEDPLPPRVTGNHIAFKRPGAIVFAFGDALAPGSFPHVS